MRMHKMDKPESKLLPVIAIYLLAGLALSWFCKYIWDLDGLTALRNGYAVWTVLYLAFFFKHFWIIVPGNHSVVLQDYFVREKYETDAQQMLVDESAIPDGQRGVSAGFRAKMPQEILLGEPINMQKAEIVTDTVKLQDKNSKGFTVTWQVGLTAVPGKYLPRFLLVDANVAKAFYKGEFSNALIPLFKAGDGATIMAKLNEPGGLNEDFGKLLGGSGKIHPKERMMGRFTGTPVIVSIVEDEADKKLDQARNMAEKNAEAVKLLIDQGVKPDVALLAVLSAQGQPVDLMSISGLEGLTGSAHFGSEMIGRKNKGGKGGSQGGNKNSGRNNTP